MIKLGLIGAGIGRSLTPFLQEATAQMLGLRLEYQLFDTPADQAHGLHAQLEQRQAQGLIGVNITHPFKEVAFGLVQVHDPMVQRIGAINTVRFGDWQGFNTDYSGFIRAYRHVRQHKPPGSVLLVGAGGAGKAVGFALHKLGASQILIVDTDQNKAQGLAAALSQAGANASAQSTLSSHTDGLVNCTPLGMYQYPGNPIPEECIGQQTWAFDAIYTPLETDFLALSRAKGLEIINGAELMFYQALDAFEIWTDRTPNEAPLRALLHGKLVSLSPPSAAF
jgi:shikimate dehydrogenase